MRMQGRISEWKDDRGFGFIAPNGGGAKVFVHFRAMRPGEARPKGGELVNYYLATQADKGPRAEDVTYVDRVIHASLPREPRQREERPRRRLSKSMVILLLIMWTAVGWHWFNVRTSPWMKPPSQAVPAETPADSRSDAYTSPAPAHVSPASPYTRPASTFKCEGKKYCSQMKSCEEATFYLNNCPDAKIDGDGDGVPCERQLCSSK